MKDDTYEVIRRERLNEVALEELIGVKNINFKYDRNTTHDCVWDEIILLDDYEKPSKEAFETKLQELIDAQPWNDLRAARDTMLSQTDKYATIDFPHGSEAAKQAWLDYRQALRDLPANTDPSNPTWPIAPGAEFPELKARLQTIETQANTAIQILSDFGISGLMDPIDTSTWPTTKSATLAVLDARLKPIETGATGARAILDLFGVENLPEFTVDEETSTIESRLTALETAGASAQQTLQAFGIDI